jgi:hypothetical protein
MAKSAKVKLLWRGKFTFRTAAHVLYAQAYTERQAWLIMCRRLAGKEGMPLKEIMNLFDGSRENYSIGLEIEFKEREHDESKPVLDGN